MEAETDLSPPVPVPEPEVHGHGDRVGSPFRSSVVRFRKLERVRLGDWLRPLDAAGLGGGHDVGAGGVGLLRPVPLRAARLGQVVCVPAQAQAVPRGGGAPCAPGHRRAEEGHARGALRQEAQGRGRGRS